MNETHRRSIVKALSYRLLGSTATGIVGWWATGSICMGAIVGLADTLVKLGLYYAHERVWQRVAWGIPSNKMEDGSGI